MAGAIIAAAGGAFYRGSQIVAGTLPENAPFPYDAIMRFGGVAFIGIGGLVALYALVEAVMARSGTEPEQATQPTEEPRRQQAPPEDGPRPRQSAPQQPRQRQLGPYQDEQR